MTDLIEPGLEFYSSQYPLEFVESPMQLKKIVKKAMPWNKCAIELNGGNQQVIEKYRHLDNDLNDLMVAVEAEIKKSSKGSRDS